MKLIKASRTQNVLMVMGSFALVLLANTTSAAASSATSAATARAGAPSKGQKAGEKVSSHLKAQLQGRLSTKMAFTGAGVKGQYQVPAEATAQIESEKPLEELLGLRTEFRDRMKAESERDGASL